MPPTATVEPETVKLYDVGSAEPAAWKYVASRSDVRYGVFMMSVQPAGAGNVGEPVATIEASMKSPATTPAGLAMVSTPLDKPDLYAIDLNTIFAITVIDTVAMLESIWPSFALNVRVSGPL